VLGELQGSAAVADGEVGPLERVLGALLKFSLELTFIHIIHEVIGPRAELHGLVLSLFAVFLPCGGRDRREGEHYGKKNDDGKGGFIPFHEILLSCLNRKKLAFSRKDSAKS